MGQTQDDLSTHDVVYDIEANLFNLIKLRSLWSLAEVADTPEIFSFFRDVPYPDFDVILRAK